MTKNQLFMKTKTKMCKSRTKGRVEKTHTQTHRHTLCICPRARRMEKANGKKFTPKMAINLYAAHLVNSFNKMINDFRSLKFLVQALTRAYAHTQTRMQSII